MTASAFSFSLMGAGGKVLAPLFPSSELVFARALICVILIFPILVYKKISLIGTHQKLLIFRSLMGFLALQCFFFTFSSLKLVQAILLNQLSPIFVILLAPYLLGEKGQLRTWLLCLGAFFGVFLLFTPERHLFLVNSAEGGQSLSIALGLMGALLAALAYLLVRRLNKKEHPLTIIFHFSCFTALGCLPLGYVFSFRFPGGADGLTFLMMGIAAFFGQWFLTKAYHVLEASKVAIYSFLTPVFSCLWGYLFWGEQLTWVSLLGALIIIGSGLLMAREQGKRFA